MIKISRSKIHPKIVFKVVSGGDNVLVIGTNNIDVVEVLKHKKAKIAQINSNQSNEIANKLDNFSKNQFDFIILNLELSKLKSTKKLIPLVSEKAKIAIFRVRNKNFITRNMKSKKDEILQYFKDSDINIIQKFYCRKNKIVKGFLAHFFSYYVIYITTKNGNDLAFQEAFTERFLKKFMNFVKGQEGVLTSERE